MNLSLHDELTACEITVWDALASGDQSVDSRLLSDRFLGVYGDGFADKADHVGQMGDGPTIISYELFDIRAMPVGEAHGLLSYRAVFTRASKPVAEEMYVSSLWEKQGSGWVSIFSQDTPAILSNYSSN